jgi:putative two-component regulator sensor histidine kinase transcriptional regulator
MKIQVFIFSVFLYICSISYSQNTANNANEWVKQAESSLSQKEYIKARYLFKLAYGSFANQGNYTKAIECGIKANSLFTRENLYKEAFDLCRDMDQRIREGEQKQNKAFPDLKFLVTKERFLMYISLKNAAQAKVQLDRLEEIAQASQSSELNKALLYAKANYYYTFGQNAQGDTYFRQLISEYKSQKEYEKINDCYRNLISIARKANNVSFMDRTYRNFMVWADSVKILTAQDELNVLKQKYDKSLETIQEKDSSLKNRQYTIIGLCTVIAILSAALVVIIFVLLRFVLSNKKLKKNISIANDHNELKTKFIQNISAQMGPTLDSLSASAESLSDIAETQSIQMQRQINALKKFSDDIQELSSLENSLSDIYEMEMINANRFCESVMNSVRDKVQPGVSVMVNAINMQVKTNPVQLEKILSHLLANAAIHTQSGKIMLDYKKRGAHTHQFIVTDNGPGIPAERQENLFKPFAEIKDLTQGDGLGLPICSLIAVKMNGSLTLDTSYTRGCRFVLELHV